MYNRLIEFALFIAIGAAVNFYIKSKNPPQVGPVNEYVTQLENELNHIKNINKILNDAVIKNRDELAGYIASRAKTEERVETVKLAGQYNLYLEGPNSPLLGTVKVKPDSADVINYSLEFISESAIARTSASELKVLTVSGVKSSGPGEWQNKLYLFKNPTGESYFSLSNRPAGWHVRPWTDLSLSVTSSGTIGAKHYIWGFKEWDLVGGGVMWKPGMLDVAFSPASYPIVPSVWQNLRGTGGYLLNAEEFYIGLNINF